MVATRNIILTGLVHRLGDATGIEDHLSYSEDHLLDMIDAGIAEEADLSMRTALKQLRNIGDKVLVAPHEFWLEDGKRAREDVTEGYDSLSTRRRVQAAVRTHIQGLQEKEVPDWVREFAQRQKSMTTKLAQELGLAPAEMYQFMMADPLPIPEIGVGQPRRRKHAKEERPVIGYTYTTLNTPRVHVMVPWYTLVEAGVNLARRTAQLDRAFWRAYGGDLEKQAFDKKKITNLKGWHDSFSRDKTHRLNMLRIAFGPDMNTAAHLQDWLSVPDELLTTCTCEDFKYTSLNNTYQRRPEGITSSYKVCRHIVDVVTHLQAFGKHPFSGQRWHTSPFLLPLNVQEGSRWSEALRLRHKLQTRLLVRDAQGKAMPANFATQSVFYGAHNTLMHEQRGQGIFMPGVMTGNYAHSLAREEVQLLRDPVYQHT